MISKKLAPTLRYTGTPGKKRTVFGDVASFKNIFGESALLHLHTNEHLIKRYRPFKLIFYGLLDLKRLTMLGMQKGYCSQVKAGSFGIAHSMNRAQKIFFFFLGGGAGYKCS